MAKKTYTSEDHEKAFRIWWETRNFVRVAEGVGIGHDTARNWAKKDFFCVQGCPWHDWEVLAAKQHEALAKRVKLYEEGNLDPVAHADAVPSTVSQDSSQVASTSARRKAVDKIVRSDLDRLAHWELLYSMIYFQLTGIPLDHSNVLKDGLEVSAVDIYTAAPRKVTTAEAGIKCLKDIENKIFELKERLGIYNKPGHPGAQTPVVDNSPQSQKVESLTIDDARRMRELLSNTPPEQLELIKKIMRADDAAIAKLLPVTASPVSASVGA